MSINITDTDWNLMLALAAKHDPCPNFCGSHGCTLAKLVLANAPEKSDSHARILVDTLELSRLVSEVLSFHESLSMDSANDRETLRAALVEVLGVQLG